MKARLGQAARRVGRRFNGRVFCCVFVATMVAVAVYASRQPRVYEARGELEVLRIVPTRDASATVVEPSAISCGEDLNTIREIVASRFMLRRVADRLSVNERDAFLRPYGSGGESIKEIERLILVNRALIMAPRAWRLELRFRHRDRMMASRIVELFLDESVAYEAKVRMDADAYAMGMLSQRAEEVAKKAERVQRELAAYRELRPGLDEEELGAHEPYRLLMKKAEDETRLHKMVLDRLSEAERPELRGWRTSRAPTVPGEDEYLWAPIIRTLAWGATVASATAALAAILFKRQAIDSN